LDEPEWANAFSKNEFYQTSPFNLEEQKMKLLPTYSQTKMVSMLVLLISKVTLQCYRKKH
jgi:hypothetical protein